MPKSNVITPGPGPISIFKQKWTDVAATKQIRFSLKIFYTILKLQEKLFLIANESNQFISDTMRMRDI